MPLAALGLPYPPAARPSHCALSALRGTLGGETMTTPGGAGTTLGDSCLQQTSRARSTGFYHEVGAPATQSLDPSLCPDPMLHRLA
jgi:hypothetical protein